MKFKLAYMATYLEVSRLIVRHGARIIPKKALNYMMHSVMAKHIAKDKCWHVINNFLQMHRGYGYLQDYLIDFLIDLCVH